MRTDLEGLLPFQRDLWRPPGRDVLCAAHEVNEDVGLVFADVLQAWWQERQDAAYRVLLFVEKAQLKGVAVTSRGYASSRAVSASSPRFAQMASTSRRRWKPCMRSCSSRLRVALPAFESTTGAHAPHGPSAP